MLNPYCKGCNEKSQEIKELNQEINTMVDEIRNLKTKGLNESGTILYLREHTQEMKMLRYTIIVIAILFALFIVWLIITSRIAFPIKVLRAVAVSCGNVV